VISRFIVIALSFIVAAVQASRGAWIEAGGLICLGSGLVCLRLAPTRPALKTVAWVAFAGTAAAMVLVFLRDY
jgi:hypothetical protein